MLNPFFLQGSKTEQGLIQDLINEQLRMYGVEVYYLPRKYVTEKTIIKEVIESKFDNAYPIEAYVDTYEGYEGQGTILSKFGIQPLTDLTLIISKERFEEYITPLIAGLANTKLSTRPKEGDLIYFPLGDRLFEIKFVEHEKPFYQLQKTYVYELKCELFRYEDEVVDTGLDQIDNNVENDGYIQTLTMVGVGTTATATTGIVNGGVRYITITNRGSGYTSTPRVAISSAPFGGINATGIATMIGNLVDCNGTTALKVQGVELTNPGAGYTVAPSVAFFGGGGTGVAATAVIGDGVVGIVTLTDGGSGYATPPAVTFTAAPSGGITAIGAALINTAGVVTSITIRNAGLGYTVTPTITISSPYMVGVGTYRINETVTGSISGASALVKTWNAVTGALEVYKITKDFVDGDIVVGAASSASYKLRVVSTNDTGDPFAQNAVIEREADEILDFSERNPFGTP